MDAMDKVLRALKEAGIGYKLIRHVAVYNMEEMYAAGIENPECIVKNLFLRDNRGKRHFLVSIGGTKRADLKDLRDQIGSSALGFASAERLEKYLGLVQGEVSPFGVLNDEDCAVEVLFDEDLKGTQVGIHPNDNTATVMLALEDLQKLIQAHGNRVGFVKV